MKMFKKETTRVTELENGSSLNNGEIDLYNWQYNKLGGFMTKIFDAMAVADTTNLNMIGKGFPEQVQAYKNYGNLKGYWSQVQLNINN